MYGSDSALRSILVCDRSLNSQLKYVADASFFTLSALIMQTCTCANTEGLAACTAMACPGGFPTMNTSASTSSEVTPTCVVNGIKLNAGDEYTAADGCNVSCHGLCDIGCIFVCISCQGLKYT